VVQPQPPEVIVIGGQDKGQRVGSIATPLARLALSLAPDLLHAVERSLAQRERDAVAMAPAPRDPRIISSGIQFSEVEYDMRVPFLRKVTVRKASAWSSEMPAPIVVEAPPAQRGTRLRRAGIVSLGGAVALTALGVLANRAGGTGLGGRRGWR
jgi:hypothetical protein